MLFNRRDDHAMHDFTRSAVLPPGCVGVTIAVKLQHHGYGGQDDSSDNDDDVSALDSVRFKLVTVTAGVRCVAVCVHSYTLSSPSRSTPTTHHARLLCARCTGSKANGELVGIDLAVVTASVCVTGLARAVCMRQVCASGSVFVPAGQLGVHAR